MRQARAAREHSALRRLRWWLLVLLCACLAPLPHAAAQAADRYAQGNVWKVESPSVEASYVFGTVHVADPRVTNLPAAVRASLDAAASFTMELTRDPVHMQQVAGRMFQLDGCNLAQVLGQPLFDSVAAVAGGLARSGRAFIAVGALHLHGERSVLALLEQRGYRVSRVY